MKTAILLALLLSSLAVGAPRTLSVCEAISIGGQLDERIVRIRGTWREAFSGSGLFDELVDEGCPGLRIQLVSADGSLPHAPPTAYKLDMASARHAQNVAEKALADGRELSATILGVLYVQKKEDQAQPERLENGVVTPPHHKWYPCILLIQAVPKIKER